MNSKNFYQGFVPLESPAGKIVKCQQDEPTTTNRTSYVYDIDIDLVVIADDWTNLLLHTQALIDQNILEPSSIKVLNYGNNV